MKRTIAALLLAGILAGCSGAAPAAPSAAAAPTPTPFKPVALPGCGCGGGTPSWDFRKAPTLLGAGFWAAP